MISTPIHIEGIRAEVFLLDCSPFVAGKCVEPVGEEFALNPNPVPFLKDLDGHS